MAAPVTADLPGLRGMEAASARWLLTHAPVMRLAFQRRVPDRVLELAPGLARIDCPCGAVVEVGPEQIEACPGPEGGECPRFYLYVSEDEGVRVANVDILAQGGHPVDPGLEGEEDEDEPLEKIDPGAGSE